MTDKDVAKGAVTNCEDCYFGEHSKCHYRTLNIAPSLRQILEFVQLMMFTVRFFSSARQMINVIGERMFEEVRERFARGEMDGDQR